MSSSIPRPSGETATLRLTPQQARELGVRALGRLGYTGEEAGIIADHLVDAALCGYRFAGLPRILAVAERMEKVGPRGQISVVRETEVSAVVDGGKNVGYLAVHRGARIAIEKAKKNGFALVGVYNSYYSGRNSYFLEMIAREDLVGIHSASGMPRVVPLGGARPAFGTNPIAFAFPSSRGPVMFDMGTASIMTGDVFLKSVLGELLPEGTAVGGDGLPTRDPKESMLGGILPFGGYKGYGLSFTVQMLGLLANSEAGEGMCRGYGFFFVVFDPNLLLPVEEFEAQLTELIDRIKATPRQPGVDEIRIPSERAFRERERNRVEGIVLDRAVYEALDAL